MTKSPVSIGKTSLKLLFLPFFLLFNSCKSAPLAAKTESALPNDPALIEKISKEANASYIFIVGEIYDLAGNLIRRVGFGHSWPENNGHAILHDRETILELDEKSKVIWKKSPYLVQHVLEKSIFNNEYLTLVSEYRNDPAEGNVRYDNLLVFGPYGNTHKSFSFMDYHKKNPKAFSKKPSENAWTADGQSGKSSEYTHGNSFSEIYSEKNGRKIHTGYVYYSVLERVVYIFDLNLKKIVNTIPTPGLNFHDIHQYDLDHLVGYNNASDSSKGAIQLINLKDKSIRPIYKFTETWQASFACSGVQSLPGQHLLILHSKCYPKEAALQGFYIEFVDLKTNKKSVLHIKSAKAPQRARLLNLDSYLFKTIE